MANDSQSDPLKLYGIVFENLRHESNGIWQRFHIVLGMNLALFGGLGFLCFGRDRSAHWQALGIAISIAGVLITAWSSYVLRVLWCRHWHWRERLEEIQKNFPTDWVRPLEAAQPLTVNLTAPYLWVLGIGWLVVLTVLVVCPAVFS